eukprot:scaffold10141_cov63-Phaeocystis_antarctica.AAC.2
MVAGCVCLDVGPGRTKSVHYLFPSCSPRLKEADPRSFLSRHALPKKLAVWRFHVSRADGLPFE